MVIPTTPVSVREDALAPKGRTMDLQPSAVDMIAYHT